MTTVGSANFNLTEYVRKSWYIQAQQVESYQPLDSLYCVTATYDLDGATVPFFRGTVVTVYNYGNKGAVNGPNVNKNNMTIFDVDAGCEDRGSERRQRVVVNEYLEMTGWIADDRYRTRLKNGICICSCR